MMSVRAVSDFIRKRTSFWDEGPFCRNCEFETDDPDYPVYFCSEECRMEFESKLPLQNFLDKRARKQNRTQQ
jgi:hypothetical protein